MLFKAKTGVAWRDLPERYGPWKTVYNRFWRWSRNGTLTVLVCRVRMIAEAIDELDREVSVDSSIVRALCGAKTRTLSLSWAFATRSGSSAVLVDQPGDGLSTVDLGGHVDHLVGIVQRRAEKAALMRPMIVEVSFILDQDRPQLPLTIDQQVIEALTA